MDRVGLPPDLGDALPASVFRRPEAARVIARALTLQPKLLVRDEVVAALDVSIRADILNLFAELQRDSS